MTTFERRLRTFAHQHDDIPAFHAAYLVLTVLVAAVFSLGYFVLMVALHMCLDFVKYREVHGYSVPKTVKAMFLESIADIALILISLTFALYLSHTLVLVTLSGLLRSELTVLRAVGTTLPKIRILEHFLAIALNFHAYIHEVHPDLEKPLTRVQCWSLRTILVCTGFIFFSLYLYRFNLDGWILVLAGEFSLSL